MGSRLIISVISMFTAFLSGCGLLGSGTIANVSNTPKPTPAVTAAPTATPRPEYELVPIITAKPTTPTQPENLSSVYIMYSKLSSTEKSYYQKICTAIENDESPIEFENANEDNVTNAFKAVIKDHPEYFWLSGGYSYSKSTWADGSSVSITPGALIKDSNEIVSKKNSLESFVNRITSLQNGISDYDKLLYIHDYIVDNTEYDEASSYTIKSGINYNIPSSSTAYGCLIEHKAICSGYSAAFQLLAQRLGIPCGRISGQKTGGGDHEWNYVVLDGDYYYVDVTWDDPIMESAIHDNKSYEYFCITGNELAQTHIIGENPFIPSCTADKYDYFKYNNLYVPYYNYSDVSKILQKYANKNVSIKFLNTSEARKAVDDLIGNSKIFNFYSSGSISYVNSSDSRLLSIYMR